MGKRIRALSLTKRRAWLAALACSAVLGCAAAARAADNDQTVVAGLGLGLYSFSKVDDIRQGLPVFGGSDEMKTAGVGELFLEWYALGTLGFGVRDVVLATSRSYVTSFAKVDQRVDVNMIFATVNWVPLGATGYTRLGFVGGVGAAEYKASQSGTGVHSISGTSNGSAGLLGIYIDWGGDAFGARFGVNGVSTTLDPLVFPGSALKYSVDASGTSVYFDLRWAW